MTTLILPSRHSDSCFGSIVAEMRHARRITQAELARRVGHSAAHLSNIEHGRSAPPTEALARRIGQALGLNASQTKAFVAEANVARAQSHAKRIRIRLQGDTAEADGSSGLQTQRSPSDEASPDSGLRGMTPAEGDDTQACAQRRECASSAICREVSAHGRASGGASAGMAKAPPTTQTVRVDIAIPERGPGYLEIDVSTEGSDCLLVMRVVPGTLGGERRRPP